jgi:hypothetical protein
MYGDHPSGANMLDLFDEFKKVVTLLAEHNIDYALCGGLALAVYGIPRATIDIDLLIMPEALGDVVQLARELGYKKEALPMRFTDRGIEIRRISKFDQESGDILMLDLLLVTPVILPVWESRREVAWEHGTLWVVSHDGLIALKSLRGSGQDLEDISRLKKESADEC